MRRILRPGLACLGAAVLCTALVGCLGYGFSGRGRVGDVYIPFFDDESSGERATNVGIDLTQRVVGEFQSDRHSRVFQATAERSLAQKELLGTVRSVTEGVSSRDLDQVGEEYRVVVVCSVTYRDLATDTVLWQSASVSGDGLYDLDRGEAGFQAALTEALEEVVRIITDNTLRAW